jgi:hypothetical protein
MSAWTLDDIAQLEKAIAQGTLRVQYADKLIEYRSLNDMLRTLDIIRKELGVAPKNGGRKFADFNKGLQ